MIRGPRAAQDGERGEKTVARTEDQHPSAGERGQVVGEEGDRRPEPSGLIGRRSAAGAAAAASRDPLVVSHSLR